MRHRQQFGAMMDGELLAWGRYFLPAHFRLRASALHRWLAEQLDTSRGRVSPRLEFASRRDAATWGLKLNAVAPRGSAKSTVVTLAFVLREALAGREPYIWIVSDTRHQAAAHLENIKAELLENPRLAAAYRRRSAWGRCGAQAAIVLRNGVMIEAFGTGQRIRGRRRREHRPTLIVCDDLQNDGHIQSALASASTRGLGFTAR